MTDPIREELKALIAAYDEHGGKWTDSDAQALHEAVLHARVILAAQPDEGEVAELKERLNAQGWADPDICDWLVKLTRFAEQLAQRHTLLLEGGAYSPRPLLSHQLSRLFR